VVAGASMAGLSTAGMLGGARRRQTVGGGRGRGQSRGGKVGAEQRERLEFLWVLSFVMYLVYVGYCFVPLFLFFGVFFHYAVIVFNRALFLILLTFSKF